ncbi:MAG: hypothetical protein HQ568_02725, partial [Calditrichaeota bacterium]|nr:hypothetical protein [Calditrichota bacterium]
MKSAREQMKTAASHLKSSAIDLDDARLNHSEALSKQAGCKAALEAARSSLQAHRSRSGSPVKLPVSLSKLTSEKGLRTVAERINCHAEHRTALAAALTDVLDVFDAPNLKTAIDIASAVEKDEQAALRFSLENLKQISDIQIPDNANKCLIAASLVQNQDSIGDFLRRRLARTLVVPDMGTLHNLIPWASDQQVRLVTPNGTLFEPDGVLRSGRIDPEALRVGWLEIEHALKDALSESEEALLAINKQTESSLNRLKQAEKTVDEARKVVRKTEDDEASYRRQAANLESDLKRLQNIRQQATSEIESLKAEIERIPVDDDADVMSKELQAKLKDLTESLKKSEEELNDLDMRRMESSEERSTTASESARIGERLAAALRAVEMHERDVRSAGDDLAALNARLAKGDIELKQVKQASENIISQAALLASENVELSDAIETLR